MAIVQTMASIKDNSVTPQRREGLVQHVGPNTYGTWDPALWGRNVIRALEEALHASAYTRTQTGPGRGPAE
eukprot:5595701-Alexandrium_andersonii.AAC.1